MEHYLGNEKCACGRFHTADIDDVIVGKGVIAKLPEILARYGAKKPFILSDANTYPAAGEAVCNILKNAGISYTSYAFHTGKLPPNEKTVGSAILHFDASCDMVIAVGSGVLNDTGKILSNISKVPYIIVGTAPSMDGYASATSSMDRDELKASLNSRCANVIIGDVDILKNAPAHMLAAGLGDMLAKYVSIAEWRIAHLITGEYYCERVAELVRSALKKCVDNADGLLKRDETAVAAVFEGLVIGGIAMAYAGVSRPASGVEHYFSHVWDMRGLQFGTQTELHGIQCAIGTYQAAKLYDVLKAMTPDEAKAKAYVAAFSYEDWKNELTAFLGESAETMIAAEKKEGKYVQEKHPARFATICEHWEDILRIIDEEIPSAEEIGKLLDTIGIARSPESMGVDRRALQTTFKATKDIRDKYVLSRLAWDLGVLEELSEVL